jgi:Acyl-CoA hydrolase
MFPADTNPAGNIFGGVILSYIDIAAGVATRTLTRHNTVTVCMKEVVFKEPVKVGDILTFWTEVVKVGRTSMTIRVKVEATRGDRVIQVTEGETVFVAVDKSDRPVPLDWQESRLESGTVMARGAITFVRDLVARVKKYYSH